MISEGLQEQHGVLNDVCDVDVFVYVLCMCVCMCMCIVCEYVCVYVCIVYVSVHCVFVLCLVSVRRMCTIYAIGDDEYDGMYLPMS